VNPTIKKALDRYTAGAPVLARSIQDLSPADLAAHPVPGTWSILQVVHHVLDSDLIASHRMKRIIAEDNPLLISYDETAFANALGYERMDVRLACDLFRLNRELTAQMLLAQPDEAFNRTGVHNQKGKVSVLEIVSGYADHLDHHLKFLYDKRARLGKPV
jgi:hypothetical protein